MGQYHKTYNIDKKEYINAHELDEGAKLMEQCGWRKSTATALWLLLANSNGRGGGDARDHEQVGRWAGDRIVIQGDYSEEGDQSHIPEEEQKQYKSISLSVKQMLDNEFDPPAPPAH